MDFYDEIAAQYDQITGVAERLPTAETFARELTARYNVRWALDVACGTGLYAIVLARLGLRVVGSDLSPAMLEQARRAAAKAGVGVQWLGSPMQELAGRVTERFDAVLCMGNSIPHLLEPGDLEGTLTGFHKMLAPGGVAIVQLLNYARLLAKAERVVGIDRQGDAEYVRFYDFLGPRVRFNILQILWQGQPPRHRLYSTTLRAYTWKELADAMAACRFTDIQVLSGPKFGPFDPEQSETVMIVGRGRKPRRLKLLTTPATSRRG